MRKTSLSGNFYGDRLLTTSQLLPIVALSRSTEAVAAGVIEIGGGASFVYAAFFPFS